MKSVTAHNSLKLKGDFLINDTLTQKVSIQVFEYSDSTYEFVEVWCKTKKRKYEMVLDPTKHYQIWFTNSIGVTKRLYVMPGDPGPYYFGLDIDFESEGLAAKIEQTNYYDYVLTAVKNPPRSTEPLAFKF
ncbi:MAG: hypothetical protein ACXADH_03085 [Candidatus Kariarchaeaceae archaeon]|jgi:hypothetical protein